MKLDYHILAFVRFFGEADFDMYLNALGELLPWFCAHDHMHYARWIPIHLPDMLVLHRTQPLVLEFRAGHFTIQNIKRIFSSIATDQAHEQNSTCINGNRGAVG